MKSFLYIGIVFILSHSSRAQQYMRIFVDPAPPVVGQPYDIISDCQWVGRSAPTVYGMEIYQSGNSMVLDIYFNYNTVVIGCFGRSRDTIHISSFDPNVEQIVVNAFRVEERPNQPIDTMGLENSDTLFLNQINVQQYATTQGFEFYPNPAKDEITIKVSGDAQVQNLILFDVAGRPVLKRESFKTENPLELPSLAEGVYILRFEKDGVVFRERILVRP